MSSGATAAAPLRIAIALSGGVDSATTALLLHRCVHTAADVHALRHFGSPRQPPPSLPTLQAAVAAGTPLCRLLRGEPVPTSVATAAPVKLRPFFIRSWHDNNDASGWCARSQRDYDDAQHVATSLRLLPATAALPVLDCAGAYAEQCFQRLLHAYAAGHTLNVDVLCNSKIKFGTVMRALQANDGAAGTLLATGHYARTWVAPRGGAKTACDGPALLRRPCSAAHDLNDQTVFLSRVPPAVLGQVLFPLGHLFRCKADVRALARDSLASLNPAVAHVAEKHTSTGICFVEPPSASTCGTTFATFLNEYLPPPPPPLTCAATDPPRTIFRDATTHARWDMDPSAPLAGGLAADYPHHLPAYSLTVGQRVRLCRRTAAGDAVPPAQSLYVARKVCFPPTDVAAGIPAVRLLREVHVVDRWDHPLLYTAHVPVLGLRWWLPIDAVRRASRCAEDGRRRFQCFCCPRHQSPPQAATVEWTDEGEGSAVVLFESPVRAAAAGQAMVVYVSTETATALLHGTEPTRESSCRGPDMAVVACAWIAPPAEVAGA